MRVYDRDMRGSASLRQIDRKVWRGAPRQVEAKNRRNPGIGPQARLRLKMRVYLGGPGAGSMFIIFPWYPRRYRIVTPMDSGRPLHIAFSQPWGRFSCTAVNAFGRIDDKPLVWRKSIRKIPQLIVFVVITFGLD